MRRKIRKALTGMKTDDTKRLEASIWKATSKQGVFGCFEVTIGFFGKERVDYMTYDTKGNFRCYEIKVTKADFRSRCHNSFVGHFNYYVLRQGLYEEVKTEIPKHIGVYVERDGALHSIKKAKRRTAQNPDVLKDSLIRSLYREVAKQIKSGDPLIIEHKNRELSRVKKERDDYRGQYWDLLREIQEKYGTRWNRTPAEPEEQEREKDDTQADL
jgi:hypothetical protein